MQKYLRHPATAGGLVVLMVLIWGCWLLSGRRRSPVNPSTVDFTGTLSVSGERLTAGNVALVPTRSHQLEEQLATLDSTGFRFSDVPVGEYVLLVDPTGSADEPQDLSPESNDSILYRSNSQTIVRLNRDTSDYQMQLVRP